MTELAGGAQGRDRSEEFAAAVRTARERGEGLCIRAGDSKRDLLGRACEARPLDLAGHSGVVDYQPRELVVTVRAATTVAALQATLAQERQTLSAAPPSLGGRATIGGSLACDLSGPGRPWTGSLRDAVLGVKLLNGRGELLRFGGTVMKNVAGYDVSRLQAGALGTLGVLCELSLKVAPLPERTLTLARETGAADALAIMHRCAAEASPLSAACWFDGRLYLRLSGADSAVEDAAARWGGERLPEENAPWSAVNDMTAPFFGGEGPLWRLSVPSTAPLAGQPGDLLLDWGGARRWLRGERAATQVWDTARRAGGHACLFRGGDRHAEVRTPPDAVQRRIHTRLKAAFDPDNVLNPGRLYGWL